MPEQTPLSAFRWAKWALVALSAVSLGMAWRVSQIGFDYDFESFFPADDPETSFYLEFRESFETDNDFLVIGFESPNSIFDEAFLKTVDGYVEDLENLPYVKEVFSPTQLEEPIRLGPSIFKRPLLRWDSPDSIVNQNLRADSIRIFNHPVWVGSIVSANAKSLLVQLSHDQKLSKAGCDSLAVAISDLAASWKYPSHIAGRSVAQKYYVDVMQREVVIFVSIGIIIIIVFLWVAFQSIWGVAVPLLVVLLSGLWTLGLMELTGKSIDVMTIVLPTIIFVVGISDVVHILSRYYEELRNHKQHWLAVQTAFKEVGLATFLTTLTTAIGFLTLSTSSVKPIQDFGIYAAVGVGIAYLLAFSLLPAVMILFPAPALTNSGKGVFWNKRLQSGFRIVLGHGKLIALVTSALIIFGVAGASKMEVNNVLLEDLSEEDPFRQEFEFFEKHFAGVRPFEMSVQITDSVDVFDWDVQSTLAEITAYLSNEYGVGSIISSDRLLSQLNRWNNGDAISSYRLPPNQQELNRLVRGVNRFGADAVFSTSVNPATKTLRIFGKLPDAGAKHFQEKNDALYQWFHSNHPESNLELRVTGTAQLIDLNIGSLASDMIQGLSLAFLIVALIAGLMFRSVAMVFIVLIPNMIPLLLIAGIMGWSGIDLKLSTSIIFTIAFGIAVDDTIHFISKLRMQLAKGHTLPYAIKRSFLGAGKAIIITSIILCGGFITLAGSSFLGTFYIGVLISLTLLLAVLADLFVLPWLILLFLNWKKQKVSDENSQFFQTLEK